MRMVFLFCITALVMCSCGRKSNEYTPDGKIGLITLEASTVEREVSYQFASFAFDEKQRDRYTNLDVKDIPQNHNEGTLTGKLEGDNGEITCEYTSETLEGSTNFQFTLEDNSINKLKIWLACEPDEQFFGGGEQFSHVNLKGQKVPVWIEEQGWGRGDQPLTFFAKMRGAAGNNFTTYCAIPFIVSSKNRAIYIENQEYVEFDFTQKDRIGIEVWSNEISGYILYGNSPKELVQQFTMETGLMPELPDWAYGTWLGLQGGKEKVTKITDEAIAAGNPVSALWIQDWVGKRQTTIGSRLWWNWEYNPDYYPEIDSFIAGMNNKGVKVLGYINPFLAEEAEMAKTAIAEDYLVKNQDGEPYLVAAGGGFNAYMFDLTNPSCFSWVKKIIKENMIGIGFHGWMADFAEWLPTDAVLHSGVSAWSYHNQYAVDWARLNREAIREAGKEGDVVFFSRSGFTGSAGYSTLFWAGDQMVDYKPNDGLPSAITALHSSGFSGISLNHSDIGGYSVVNQFPIKIIRDRDLFYRWAELNVFSPVFRTHEGLKPDDNFQFYDDMEGQAMFAKLGQLHLALKPYIQNLVKEAAKTGLPVVRHPYLVFPEDERTMALKHELLLGDDLLVIPVIKANAKQARGYLPKGEWKHVWTGDIYPGGGEINIEAPYGQPAAFIRIGGQNEILLQNLIAGYLEE